MKEIIDLLKKYTDGKKNIEKVEVSVLNLNRIIKALEKTDVPDINDGELISRQPEKRTEERTKTHACYCISQKAAIDAIQRLNIPEDMCVFEIKSHILVAIATLPPVEPERKPGKWLLKIEDWNRWTCSECGFSTRTDIHVTLGYDYCPKCGAPMEVKDEM